jgi:hypothetical protein
MENTFKKQKIIAFTFSIIYVGLGTLTVFTSYGSDKYYFKYSAILYFITFPVSFISNATRFVTNDYVLPVIITQLLMLWLTYTLTFILLRNNYQKKMYNKHNNI